MKTTNFGKITIAANNGDVGGGEIMLLALAEELSSLGHSVTIVGPSSPTGLVDEAVIREFETVKLVARTRVEYLRSLRLWDRHHREGLLWCNGLLPAVATAGHGNRIVHLHQRPRGSQRLLAGIARWGSLRTLVPSINMSSVLPGSVVLHNWVPGIRGARLAPTLSKSEGPIRLGFLGRPSTDKGVEVLADAVRLLNAESTDSYKLVLGGESRFVNRKSRTAVEAALAGLGNLVERTGWIEPADFFRRVDVLVCPSIWPEPFGLVVAESMSARVPVVVSDAGALPEVVGPRHPWISQAGNAEDLARVIRQATAGDPAAVDRAYTRWHEMWSPEAGRRRLTGLLEGLKITARVP